jgi:arylsulfatase A-like enzyme
MQTIRPPALVRLLSLALVSVLVSVRGAPPPPNFVVITIDDLGYADIGPFGSTRHRTPNLDRMAREGRKLTSFYAAPVCSPSRAALMTGCYAKRALPIPHVLFPGNAEGLAPEEITVAEVLRAAGYATGIVGKWHLGDQPEFLPTRQGFDEWFGIPYSNDMGPAADGVKSDLGKPLPPGSRGGQPPLPLLCNETVLQRVRPDDQQALLERYTEEAIAFIDRHRARPFFLYLPHHAVHFPIYPGKAWAGRSPHGYYADWVEEMDAGVGKVLDALRERGLAERTLVLFTSDNGGTPRGLNTPLRGHKGSTWEGGMRVPTLAWWPGRIPAGTESNAICAMMDVLPTLAALGGGQVPPDRKIDGRNLWPLLAGEADPAPRETFYYYQGLNLRAVRHQQWKLHLGGGTAERKGKGPSQTPVQLYDLVRDPGEAHDLAAAHPEVVARLQALAEATRGDLGLTGLGPGVRPLGKVGQPAPILDHDGKVRAGLSGSGK